MNITASVLEVDQLQPPRRPAAPEPQHQRVEAHLKQRLLNEARPGRAARLVVHHPHRPVAGHVQAVDEAAQEQPAAGLRLDEQLALGRLEPGGVLQPEVRKFLLSPSVL